jgi:2-desacetyl-2-hydroxyethyl bacteriochlorophyllide A dehydrogenase
MEWHCTKDYSTAASIFSGGHHKHVGYFAAEVSQPQHHDNLILKLPECLDLKRACLFGLAGVAMHDVRRSELSLGERALVVGAGSVGLFTAQIARAAGAHVTICDLDSDRLAIAKSVGIQETVRIEGDETWKEIKASGPFHVVFEDSGAPVLDKIVGSTWNQGLITRRGRIIVIAGRFDVNFNFNAGQSHEAALLHASHFDRSDLEEVCRLVVEGVLQVDPLIKDVIPLADAASVYERLRDDPGSLLGTILDWSNHP